MGFKAWRHEHNAKFVENMPRRSPVAMMVTGVVWIGAAAFSLFLVAVARGGSGTGSEFMLLAAMSLGLAAWSFWIATRYRIAHEATAMGGSLVLTASRWSVTLQPGDVSQVVQVRQNPYGGRNNARLPEWGVWIRIDSSAGGLRPTRYLVMRPDAPDFLEQLRGSGFPVVGEVTPIPDPS